MRRATITISTDLDEALEAYIKEHDATPSLTAVAQAALREFLVGRGYLASEWRPLRITPAEHGSGVHDASIDHDRYLTEP